MSLELKERLLQLAGELSGYITVELETSGKKSNVYTQLARVSIIPVHG